MFGLVLVVSMLAGWVLATPSLDRLQRLAGERYGAEAERIVSDWRQLVEEAHGLPVQARLERANDFFNRRLRFKDDRQIWDQKDYWATPLEAIAKGAADCEDYSIAKYMTLRLMGVSPEKLRLIYVKARIGGPRSSITQAHMVLGYYPAPDDEPLILDNLIGELRPASGRGDLSPIFTFNAEGLWVGGASTSAANPTARLSRWRDVLERMREEGLW